MTQTGDRVVWRVDTGSVSHGLVGTDGHGRDYTTADTVLIALDDQGATWRVAWRVDPHDDITEVPAGLAADGTVLLGSDGRAEWAYRPDGKVLWGAPAYGYHPHGTRGSDQPDAVSCPREQII